MYYSFVIIVFPLAEPTGNTDVPISHSDSLAWLLFYPKQLLS